MSEAVFTTSGSGRSWRAISQEVTPRAMSRRGRSRRRLAWFKTGLLCVVLTGVGYVVWDVIHLWQHDRTALSMAAGAEPMRDVALITDGTLTKKWVEDTLALPKGATLMAVDLPALRDKLAANGQVRLAVVTRDFPSMLVVNLQERTPVARLQVQDGQGKPKQLFVARDGVVYDGINYDRQMVASLPWLAGLRLVRSGGGYAPVDGMTDVAGLLTTAQLQASHLYRGWMIVSLARLAERDEIVVKSQDIPEIIFSRREDFFKQIAQLDYITDKLQETPQAVLQTVNLALGGQVPVQVAPASDELSKRDLSPQFTLSTTQRKGNRDL
jgi:cell division septal protein FtsQ